jgi:hypothetical protein
MAGDYEDFYDLENMTDEELEQLVREQLDEQPEVDPAGLEIRASSGRVTIGGRIGTEAEYQIVERVLTDVIGIASVTNELVVDSLTRVEQSEGADEANAELYGTPRGMRGGANRTEDTAAHLLEDTGAEQFGTNDVGEAVERGYSWNPPTTPTQEGQTHRENH